MQLCIGWHYVIKENTKDTWRGGEEVKLRPISKEDVCSDNVEIIFNSKLEFIWVGRILSVKIICCF